jgi:hypothetical protein
MVFLWIIIWNWGAKGKRKNAAKNIKRAKGAKAAL